MAHKMAHQQNKRALKRYNFKALLAERGGFEDFSKSGKVDISRKE